jgi:TonB-linked SusC/RagA family outer membrane protein
MQTHFASNNLVLTAKSFKNMKNCKYLQRMTFGTICPTKTLRIMKLTMLLILAAVVNTFGRNTYSQNTRVNLDLENVPMEAVFSAIEDQSEFFFLYSSKMIDVTKRVNIHISDKKINEVLDEILKESDIQYQVKDRQILLTRKELAGTDLLQQQKVTGTVSDAATGESLIGVNVVITGTTTGVVTDLNGKYSIEVPASGGTLTFSYIGYNTEVVPLDGRTMIDMKMVPGVEELKEVVITALGIKHEERSLGYAVQKVSGETFTGIKGENISTSLTGKVAGLMVQNTTEFFRSSSIKLRGSDALIVVNGVPTSNLSLDDISPDDISDISILKGATASALYGNRGSNGAIMISTKREEKKSAFSVEINSSTMMKAGYLKIPKTQTSYGTGVGNQPVYDGEFVWGPHLDMGTTALQVDPETGQMKDMPLVSIGKNNLKNFLEPSIVTNNNISVSQSTKDATFRASFSHVYNKGEAPNTRSNKYIFNVSGTLNVSEKFTLDASWNYSKRETPNQPNYGYGRNGSYIYLLTVWNGPDFDIRQWKDYWMIKDKEQKYYQTGWYDNPYFLSYEVLNPHSIDVNTGQITANYNILPELKVLLRSGMDTYNDKYSQQQAMSFNRSGKGYFLTGQNYSMNLNNDLLLTFNKGFGKFGIDALGGGSLNYYQYRVVEANTNNGLSIPAFYSLNASVDPVSASNIFQKKQVNSLYGKLSLSYAQIFYLDMTGRNDWSSTLPASTRSYFYPSVALSTLISDLITMPEAISFWKVRASWTVSKQDLGIFDLNQAYNVTANAWNGMNAQTYPTVIRGEDVKPQTSRVYELGTNIRFLNNRINFDYAYFNRLQYNLLINTPISNASGFGTKQTNTKENWVQRGMEVTVKGIPVKKSNLEWEVMLNWSYNHWYYDQLDAVYSDQKTYIKEGARYDVVRTRDWERDPDGHIVIGSDGYPKKSNFFSENIGYSDPDWIWGLTNSFKLKNWSFYFTFDGRVGGLEYSDTEYGLWAAGSHPDSDNQWRYDEVVNGKTEYIGDGVRIVSGELVRDGSGEIITDTRVFAKNDIKVPYTNYMGAWSGYGSDDGGNPRVSPRELFFSESFLKLRELAINYNFSRNICESIGMHNCSIGIIGQNLLIWTKEFRFDDPDSGSGNLPSPSQRYVGLNIKMGF